MLVVILGVLIGGGLGWLINTKLLAGKFEKKADRVEEWTSVGKMLQIGIYACCIFFVVSLFTLGYLRSALSTAVEYRVQAIVGVIAKVSGEDVMQAKIDSTEFIAFINEAQQSLDALGADHANFVEKRVHAVFGEGLSRFLQRVSTGGDALAAMQDADGQIAVRSIVTVLKDAALDGVNPTLRKIERIIALLLLIPIIIIIVYVRKGGGKSNRATVFGEGHGEDKDDGLRF